MKIALALAVAVVDITTCLTLARAQVSSSVQLADALPTPPSTGIPDGRKPAGSRGSCEETGTPLTPLLPVTDSGYSGLTLKEHPTFWFFVPYKTNNAISGKFFLEDGEENILYRTSFKLPKTPGFVSVSIPQEKTLEVNKQYHWQFKIYCLSGKSYQPGFVLHEGLVQRVALPDLENQLKKATLTERIALYIANKMWYDVPAELAKIRRHPEDWANLLRAMGLEQLEVEPIAGAVMPAQN